MLGNNVKWPDGIVPYEFEPGFSKYLTFVGIKFFFSKKYIYQLGFAQETLVYETMVKVELLLSINNNICIHFRPKNPTDIYYIVFTNTNGCSSYVIIYPLVSFL